MLPANGGGIMALIRKTNLEGVWVFLLCACAWAGMNFMVADILGWLGVANRAAILSAKPNLIGGIVYVATLFPSIILVLHVMKRAEEGAMLKPFAPEEISAEAMRSGFFQCQICGLVWFGDRDIKTCPAGPHGNPVCVVLVCRTCDTFVSADGLAEHLCTGIHAQGTKDSN
jgi:hypothetical protein